MMLPRPYDGTNSLQYPIHQFFQQLNTYIQAKGIPPNRQCGLLDSLIIEPASIPYQDALTADPPIIAQPAIPAQPGLDAPAAAAANAWQAIETAYRTLFTNRKNWLIARYHGPNEQAAIRANLESLRMRPNESPQEFF